MAPALRFILYWSERHGPHPGFSTAVRASAVRRCWLSEERPFLARVFNRALQRVWFSDFLRQKEEKPVIKTPAFALV